MYPRPRTFAARRDNVGELNPNPTLLLYLSLLSRFFAFFASLCPPVSPSINRPFQFCLGDILLTEHKYRPSGSTIRSHLISLGSTLRA